MHDEGASLRTSPALSVRPSRGLRDAGDGRPRPGLLAFPQGSRHVRTRPRVSLVPRERAAPSAPADADRVRGPGVTSTVQKLRAQGSLPIDQNLATASLGRVQGEAGLTLHPGGREPVSQEVASCFLPERPRLPAFPRAVTSQARPEGGLPHGRKQGWVPSAASVLTVLTKRDLSELRGDQ